MFEFEITKRENLYACAGCSCVARFRSFIYLRQKRRKAGGGRRGGNPLRRGRGPKGCRATPPLFFSATSRLETCHGNSSGRAPYARVSYGVNSYFIPLNPVKFNRFKLAIRIVDRNVGTS